MIRDLERAEKLIDREEYDKGEVVCRRYTGQQISDENRRQVAFANYLLAHSTLKKNKGRHQGFCEGLRYYTRSIRADPSFPDAYLGRGGLLRFRADEMGKEKSKDENQNPKIIKLLEKAEEDFLQAALLEPANAERRAYIQERLKEIYRSIKFHKGKIVKVA